MNTALIVLGVCALLSLLGGFLCVRFFGWSGSETALGFLLITVATFGLLAIVGITLGEMERDRWEESCARTCGIRLSYVRNEGKDRTRWRCWCDESTLRVVPETGP